MSDYISREAAIDCLYRTMESYYIKRNIMALPAADVKPVRRGRWVTREVLVNPLDGVWHTFVNCSECSGEAFKHEVYGYQRDDFCHLCGADMREGNR